jgi:hypothetical protein
LPAKFEGEIKINVRKTDFDEKIMPLFKNLFEEVPLTKFRHQLNLLETVTIKKGQECHNCKKPFQPLDPQFHCYECQIWFCEECGEKIDETKKGNNSLVHFHNMIWINVKEVKEIPVIDRYKLGENKTFDENFKRLIDCNGCGNESEETSYICLNCKPVMFNDKVGLVDICQNCFCLLRKK